MPRPAHDPLPSRPGWPARVLAGLLAAAPLLLAAQAPAPSGHGAYREVRAERARGLTADHSRFKVLQGPFKDGDGPAVTRACLTCHTRAAEQVMATRHWTWRPSDPARRGYGKATRLANNFCIAIVGGNQEACSTCHAGYGMDETGFDGKDPARVDCLVCHDTTGDYEKIKGGWPNPAVPLAEIARKVGPPSTRNCGVCHFFGGGADATKHGDLDDTILKAKRSLDVHLARDGADMACVDCHQSRSHEIAGPDYGAPAERRERARFAGEAMSRMACTACHGEGPHRSLVLNRHYRKVACQTCHVPAYARGGLASNLWWDWSTAGRTRNGLPYKEHDAQGLETYNTIHGDMLWARNVKPDYLWYDGTMTYTLLTDRLPAQRPVPLNPVHGSYPDSRSKLWPFKRHEGNQPFDPVNNTLVAPYTAGPRGSGAFWGDHDWDTAIAKGMATAGLPYSGRHGFVRTTMWWPITHMVAPKEQALGCTECHAKGARLEGLKGFYLPGRDRSRGLDLLGWGLVALVALAAAVHGTIRFFSGR